MESPDLAAMKRDLQQGEYLIGVSEERWGLLQSGQEFSTWPTLVFWIAAAARPTDRMKYYLQLNCDGYPNNAPTGTLWDYSTGQLLTHQKWPRRAGRMLSIFRTDWEQGRALYYPYDRHGLPGHPQWATQHPHLVWDRNHTIVDVLCELYSMFNSADYLWPSE
jgi:hypothetical protein